MKPPRIFKRRTNHGYSRCEGCGQFKHCLLFRHEGRYWILCETDYVDYWENTDELSEDYKEYL